MKTLAIDPGPTQCGWAIFEDRELVGAGIDPLDRMCALQLGLCGEDYPARVAIEMVACYGMPIGRDVLETVLVTGRLAERFGVHVCRKVYRREVKHLLCNSLQAKDSNVRQAIIDRFPATGQTTKGELSSIGTKANPGPLYPVKSHAWAAVGVGLVALEQWDELEGFDQ